jgi:hypothetical protein
MRVVCMTMSEHTYTTRTMTTTSTTTGGAAVAFE